MKRNSLCTCTLSKSHPLQAHMPELWNTNDLNIMASFSLKLNDPKNKGLDSVCNIHHYGLKLNEMFAVKAASKKYIYCAVFKAIFKDLQQLDLFYITLLLKCDSTDTASSNITKS